MTPSRAAREGALAIVEADRELAVVTGAERLEWLNGLLTADIAHLAPREGVWSLQLDRIGKIVSEVDVLGWDDRLVLAASSGLLDFLRGYLIMEDADLRDDSAAAVLVRLHGPHAVRAAEAAAVDREWARIDWTGLGGAGVVTSRDRLASLLETLAREGAVVGAQHDWDVLRLERGVPRWGVDFDRTSTAHDASLERRAVSWSKGCYLGQEVVCTQDMRGKVRRRLAVIALDAPTPPGAGAVVLEPDGTQVGQVTSAVWSGIAGAALAFARVRTATAEPGTTVSVNGASGRVTVERW